MEYYTGRQAILDRDFHRLRISATKETEECIRSILKNLNIPTTEWHKFSGALTVYEFLLQLARDGHPQVNYIIDVLDEQTRFSTLERVLGAGILFSFTVYLLTQPALHFIISGILYFFSSIISFPILGLLYNCGLFAYYFYDYYQDRKKPNFNRFRDYTFLILSTAATVAAYIVLIATAATMSPVIAGLYVTASAIDFLREVFCLAQEFHHYFNRPPIDEEDYLRKNRDYLRHVFGFEKRRNTLAISFVAGLLIVAITALWCFLPGGMAATIFALSAIGIVYLIKIALVKRNETILREHLQEQLHTLEENYSFIISDYNDSLQQELSASDSDSETEQNISPYRRPVPPLTPSHRPFFASLDDKNLLVEETEQDNNSNGQERSASPFRQRTPFTPNRRPFFASLEDKNLMMDEAEPDKDSLQQASHSSPNLRTQRRKTATPFSPGRRPFFASLENKNLVTEEAESDKNTDSHPEKNTLPRWSQRQEPSSPFKPSNRIAAHDDKNLTMDKVELTNDRLQQGLSPQSLPNLRSPRQKPGTSFSPRRRPFFASLEDKNLLIEEDTAEPDSSEEKKCNL
ncbi:MAG: UbiA prenyltransferase family protein [Tatlockia sp.]|nr:UbiA prenyltransferase family protein [Tatlockia sp.]